MKCEQIGVGLLGTTTPISTVEARLTLILILIQTDLKYNLDSEFLKMPNELL